MLETKQAGFALIVVLIALAVLATTTGGVVVWGQKNQPSQESSREERLLQILPPKEKAELESAIRQAQQVLKNIKIFQFTPPTAEDIKKSLNQINKQTPQLAPTIPPVDIQKIEEYFRQNPPAVPHSPAEIEGPSSQEQEYYYRKYILKDPAFQ